MKIAVYSTKSYDQAVLNEVNKQFDYTFSFFDFRLTAETAKNAVGHQAVCLFVNDECDGPILAELHRLGIRVVALRCAGFDNIDLPSAHQLGIDVVRVPAYSPEAVAEHTIGMMMCLNRRIHRAYQRTREGNFSLEGLTGFNMFGKTVGIIGTGKIGLATLRILRGFGMELLATDPYPSVEAEACGTTYTSLEELLERSDIISLHCPMTSDNHHLLNACAFEKMKRGVMIINTSRGGLIDSSAAIEALKEGKVGALGMDVYENERELFFEDKSNEIIQDDIFGRLSACHNVLFTGHQAFLTQEALSSIALTTLTNLSQIFSGQSCDNAVR